MSSESGATTPPTQRVPQPGAGLRLLLGADGARRPWSVTDGVSAGEPCVEDAVGLGCLGRRPYIRTVWRSWKMVHQPLSRLGGTPALNGRFNDKTSIQVDR